MDGGGGSAGDVGIVIKIQNIAEGRRRVDKTGSHGTSGRWGAPTFDGMIRINITPAAYAVISRIIDPRGREKAPAPRTSGLKGKGRPEDRPLATRMITSGL